MERILESSVIWIRISVESPIISIQFENLYVTFMWDNGEHLMKLFLSAPKSWIICRSIMTLVWRILVDIIRLCDMEVVGNKLLLVTSRLYKIYSTVKKEKFEYLLFCIIHLLPAEKEWMINFVRSWISVQHFSISLDLNTLEPSIDVEESNDFVKILKDNSFLRKRFEKRKSISKLILLVGNSQEPVH